jgi:DNA primase
MSVADEIKTRIDIVDYIQRYVPLKRAGRTYKAPCPFHQERTPSFVVNPDRQSWRCFGACSTGGDVISFAMKHHGWSFSEALQELGKLAGVEVRQRTPEQREQDERLDVLRGLLHTAMDAYHNALFDPKVERRAEALRYAREKRGFTDETITRFKIGYAPPGWTHMLNHLKSLGYSEEQAIEVGLAIKNEDSGRVYDRFRYRLMIPIRDERGRAIGFGARALDPEDNPKYLNSPQTVLFDKSKTLFGLDMAKQAIREGDTAVIVEGYMDAMQAHQAGFKNVVAQMGTAMTETQLRAVTRFAKKLILALDSDAAGQSATRRSLETARTTLQADWAGRLSADVRVLNIPDAKDPDDLIRESPGRWAELVAQATPVADYVIDMETAGLPENATVQERESVARSLLPLLAASEDQLYTRDNLQKLALRLRIAERDLLAWADEQAQIRRAKAPRKPSPSQHPPLHEEGEKVRAQQVAPLPGDYPPDGYDDGLVSLPASPQPARQAGPAPAMEVQCLRILFRQPLAYYLVNRKLRELGSAHRELLDGPLGDWCAEDFSHSDTRALMQVFEAAIKQHEYEPLDYLRLHADPALHPQLDAILTEELTGLQERVRGNHLADLQHIWSNIRQMIEASDPFHEVVEKALRLRVGRLQREREELGFLQIDSQAGSDQEAEARFQRQLMLSITAKGLIEAELHRQMSMLRE